MVYFECFLRYNINGPNDDGQCILIDIFFDAGDFSRSCSITSSLKPPSLNLSDSLYMGVSSIEHSQRFKLSSLEMQFPFDKEETSS